MKKLARGLEGIEEGTAYGSPALKVGGSMFACMAIHKSAEPGTLVVCMSLTERDLRMQYDPDTYYLKPHYEGGPCVLVRLSRIGDDELRDVLEVGWHFVRDQRKRRK